METKISVIICTHNPRRDYLQRTVDALKAQDLPFEEWEFLLIDNASDRALRNDWDLSWHPRARHIEERELGLTPARLRGIRESVGNLLVFVDDDNVLAKNYLTAARELFAQRPDLGVASGRLLPEYETAPPAWFGPHESWLAIRRIEESRWAVSFAPEAEPCGAGMCLRKDIALAYAVKVVNDANHRMLGRKGGSLLSGEDVAITKVALGMGYSMGQFIELNATHLIPGRRVSEEYLFTLYRNLQASGQLISWLEEKKPLGMPNWRVFAKAFLRFTRGNRVERRLVMEELRAMRLVRNIIRKTPTGETTGPAALGAASLQKS